MNIKKIIEDSKKIYIQNGNIVIDYSYPYCIELKRCNTPEKILGWINQLSGKNWMTTERLNYFIQIAFKQINIEVNYNI